MTAGSVTLNPGAAGEDVATDETGGVVYQKIKIVDGTTDGTEGVTASAANGLEVDVTQVQGTVTVDGSGVTQPVSGTITANLSATDNAVLDTIDAVLDTINAKLVTGTVIGDVNLGATDNAVLDSIVSGQLADGHNVTVDNASIAITHAALTELAAAINTNELDINIASDSVGIGGGTQYTEDAVAAADPVGNAQILIRDDAPVSVAADGDNVAQRGTEYGAAYTQIVDSSGNFIDSFGGSGGTSSADDADFTAGTTLGTITQGVYESSPTSVTDGDVGAVGITSTRQLRVEADLGATDNAVLDAIAASVDSIDTNLGGTATDDTAFAAGSEDGVPIMGAATSDSVDSGDVGVLAMDTARNLKVSIEADNAGIGGGTQYAEDAAHTTGDTGTMSLAVRNDTLAALAGTDGDYAPFQVNASGALFIQEGAAMDVSAATVTVDLGANNDVTVTNPTAANLQAEVQGEVASGSSDSGNPVKVGGVYSTTQPTHTTNQRAAAQMTSRGAQIVAPGADAFAVEATLQANSGVDIGDVDVLSLPASTNTIEVVGDVAHDAAAAGNPVLGAARATSSIEGLTQVAAADSSYVTSDLNGCLVTRNGTTLEEIVSERISNTNGTSTDLTTFAAGGAGIHAYITEIAVTNTHATTSGYVDFRNGAAGGIVWTMPAPAIGGSVLHFDPPLKFSANTAVAYDVSAAITTVYISVNGFFAQG